MPSSAPTEVDPATLIDWMKDPDVVTVLGVRSPAEFETRHITGSYNLPLDLVGEHAARLAALAGALGTGLTISARTDACTIGRVLSALLSNRGTKTDAQRLLNQLPTAESAARS